MKYLCLVSHEQPGDEPGRFRRFVAGETYDLAEEPEGAYFSVYGFSGAEMRPPGGAGKKRKAGETEG